MCNKGAAPDLSYSLSHRLHSAMLHPCLANYVSICVMDKTLVRVRPPWGAGADVVADPNESAALHGVDPLVRLGQARGRDRNDRWPGAIAALLGHKTLAMTMVYARTADKTVADEYFAVTEKVEALYHQPRQLPAEDEGTEMRRLRAEMHRRMLGNGYCARPVDMDCHFESICESCTFFVTTIAFRPMLQQQRDDAERKGQVGRQTIFDGLLTRLDQEAAGS